MADLPYKRLRCATGTLPGRKPRNCTRPLRSSSRSLTFASRSIAGTTTRYSRLRPAEDVSVTCIRPAEDVSVTCIDIALHGPYCAHLGRFFGKKTSALLVRAEGLEPPRLSS